jgi:hypothetical protein
MKIIFVAGAWGSGTTALAGALSRLGVPAFGPHLRLNDPRTPNSYELVPFRKLILRFVDQEKVSIKEDCSEGFVAALKSFAQELEKGEFGNWAAREPKRLVLKLPIASICLPQITRVFETSILVVHRPLEEIEASRNRRRWPPNFGAAGARVIYSRALFDLAQLKKSYLAVSHFDLTNNTERILRSVIEFCGLNDLDSNLSEACAFIRNDEGEAVRTHGRGRE